MSKTRMIWPVSALVLTAAGVALAGTGLYFIFLRPPLMPEDVRHMSLSFGQLDVVRLHLEAWLTRVFRVLSGYILAIGVLTVTVAATSFRAHRRGAALGAAIGGAASMILISNGFCSPSHWLGGAVWFYFGSRPGHGVGDHSKLLRHQLGRPGGTTSAT